MGSNWTERRVVVTGLGAVTPLGNQVDEFWQNLLAGRCGIGRITRFDPARFDSQIAGEVKAFDPSPALPSPKEIRRTDRFSQFGLHAAWQALRDSGLDLERVNRDEVGVLIGSGIGGLQTVSEQCQILSERGPGRLSAFMIPMLIVNMPSGIFSMYHKLRGPNFATCSACATANHALGEAWRTVKMGDAQIMFAGGAEATIVPIGIGGFCAMKALSTRNDDPARASRPFDRERDGFVMGEGAGVLVLEELEHAKKRGARIYAEIAGYGNTADANHVTAPSPDGEGAARCMKIAVRGGGLNLEAISYINAHGTSTPQGDIAETRAIKALFGDHARRLAVSSIKGATGHMLGAAGAVEMIACVKAIQTGIIPPTINYEVPDPECDLDYVPNTPRPMKIEAALNNSFGFGGHNASILVKKFNG
ncbi:MAG TPA: beta-ketoacyl-ACP synthase II [Verrucomicrobiota bacterium]|jgi:3-oxoacyl-[acyl-carrier-protein] synthase II|nr:beta-ketoacyl-ACP synthase II [Verrucomicrobiota bacterium]HRR65951.1 beta-ketoacyl-ACP synthase II [Candidatus Paceibacterota bacterium]MBP8015441.1 beta-ketoacyl-ACP synthase II [Verrucomicrobiota bacterium]NLH85450.1 beta-ketoacyl-ACP synthase II [Verrucomicrobiota bacterium]HNR70923.1 beta-ketoacyl-ACP synthase II [Verrucomicrobiota bacterium]